MIPAQTMDSLADDFFLEMTLKNRSPETIKSYRWYIGKFLEYLVNQGIEYPGQLTPEIFQGYHLHIYLGSEGTGRRGAARVNPYLVPIKSFMEYLKEVEVLPGDPARGIHFAREPKLLPKEILSRDEMVDLIEAPDITTVLGYRDRTIMELLYSTAIRRNECRQLKVMDVDFDEGLIRVMGKGRKERMTPVGRIALKFLDHYVRSVRPLLVENPAEVHLFVSSRGRGISRNVIGSLIGKYADRVRIAKRVTPHTFRHTCATHMLRNRADIRHIQALLGHESLNSTQIYTHVAVTDLREVLSKYHPREQDHG